jgi:hypothetical protein
MKLTGENRSTRGKTCPNATSSITNPTWTDPGLNPGLRGGRPAANRLSHGTASSRSCKRPTSYTDCPLEANSIDKTLQELLHIECQTVYQAS